MSIKNILIIEDEIDLANMIKKYFVREHYQVEISVNGDDALNMIERLHPDMILLDLMLPGKDGLEILRQVRMTSTVPVIIISAKETEFDRVLGLKIGADDYMTKPFSIKELVARVETLFRRIDSWQSRQNTNKRLQIGDIFMNLLSREITKDRMPVNLTTKEFDVFAFLVEHPKQVFSKEQIYDNVWGPNEYGDINTVTIHIQKIREKLGQKHGITTIRGMGYRFDGEIK